MVVSLPCTGVIELTNMERGGRRARIDNGRKERGRSRRSIRVRPRTACLDIPGRWSGRPICVVCVVEQNRALESSRVESR